MPIQTVEPQRLYRQIADQLRALLTKGEYPVGTRLPAERDLARQLGVSRPSVREALIALEVDGWVEIRTGSGVYALDRSRRKKVPAAEAEWGPLELIRARRVVEGETAAIAAALGKRKHIDAMSRAIDSMRQMSDRNLMPLDGDRAFHLAIVDACDNAVLAETVQNFWDSRRGPIFSRLGGYFETVKSWRSAIDEHVAIRDAIAARDPEAARAAMHAHMDKAHQRFSASWRRAQTA
ncbi:FadR family transcriptional regulator [Variovorax sp. PAMC28562]|uniref:FadR/GntR family transcriptional regulator n=1 Tax=Variovorax sp. PAMC28562 TaxID=2762323 RepID=UPI00164D369D|nr:FadR/GntR family transcriptional regulator [Variovorax sp. PAMC28562]QNK75231.1 FadR family transcriptional regulator [Variovorax sp. PAMC28562]